MASSKSKRPPMMGKMEPFTPNLRKRLPSHTEGRTHPHWLLRKIQPLTLCFGICSSYRLTYLANPIEKGMVILVGKSMVILQYMTSTQGKLIRHRSDLYHRRFHWLQGNLSQNLTFRMGRELNSLTHYFSANIQISIKLSGLFYRNFLRSLFCFYRIANIQPSAYSQFLISMPGLQVAFSWLFQESDSRGYFPCLY